MLFSVCILIVGLIILLALIKNQLLTAVLFPFAWAMILSIMPLLSSLAVEYRTKGYQVNFSLTRAFGSTFYALSSIMLGKFFVAHSSEWLLWFTLSVVIGLILSGAFLPSRPMTDMDQEIRSIIDDHESFQEDTKAVNNFKWVLMGISLLMIMHNINTSFMLQILNNVGGNEANVGLAIGISSMAEIPILIFYNPLAKRINHKKLLFISAIGFTLKSLTLASATSIESVYLSQSLQIIAYGLYVSAILEYTNAIMKPFKAIKAQFDISIFLTIGGIVGNILCGYLLEQFTVKIMLYFGVITTTLGLLCFVRGLNKNKKIAKQVEAR